MFTEQGAWLQPVTYRIQKSLLAACGVTVLLSGIACLRLKCSYALSVHCDDQLRLGHCVIHTAVLPKPAVKLSWFQHNAQACKTVCITVLGWYSTDSPEWKRAKWPVNSQPDCGLCNMVVHCFLSMMSCVCQKHVIIWEPFLLHVDCPANPARAVQYWGEHLSFITNPLLC